MIYPAFQNSNIPIVYTFDSAFVNYASVSIKSLLCHTSTSNNYDFIIFENDLSELDKIKLLSLKESKNNVSIRIYNTVHELHKHPSGTFRSHAHLSIATYFRLFIPNFLSNYSKLIYIDSDTILLADVAKLYSLDLGNAPFCAYVEPPYPANYRMNKDHFNDGVLVMNIDLLKKDKLLERAVPLLLKYKDLPLPGQDVINMLYTGQIHPLPVEWNFCWHLTERNLRKTLDPDKGIQILHGLVSPKLIHYASPEKPWNSPEKIFANFWWEYAKQLPFYHDIELQALQDQIIFLKNKLKIMQASFAWKITYPIRKVYDFLKYDISSILHFWNK